ncbi:hypothetical protein GCM10011379_52530 [Filimonas zeae]|uniref:NodB homology domain-containing protein n=1 Tax=Filimonas zeae TaxID=1737353 RepID=A0A917J568_9BACT|nr:polysaccharide deacetylase family protein [Filimonas zeae]GGH80928.1 hypothetical protein GCM10011379_52530 [Filimonas zeae]
MIIFEAIFIVLMLLSNMFIQPERRFLRALVLVSLNTIALLTACSNSSSPAHDSDSTVADTEKVKPFQLMTDSTAEEGFKWKPPVYDSSKCYIYLTFDDGPQNGTMSVYNICRNLGVKATYFMVGQHVYDKKTTEIVDSIRLSYPQALLANHSYTHAGNHYQYFYTHPVYALNDFLRAQKSLKVPYKIIRLPGNSAWVRDSGEVRASKMVKPVSILLDSLGYNVIGWDLEWNFTHKESRPVQHVSSMLKMVSTAVERKESHARNHIVILAHDRMFRRPQDADSLRLFISELQKNSRYVFETIDNYPRLKHPEYSVAN